MNQDDQAWITLYFKACNSVMTLWTVYVLVVALLAGFVAQKGQVDSVKWLLIAAFALFAIANGYPLWQTQSTVAKVHAKLSCDVRKMFTLWSPRIVISVHVILDAIVLWFLYGGHPWVSPCA